MGVASESCDLESGDISETYILESLLDSPQIDRTRFWGCLLVLAGEDIVRRALDPSARNSFWVRPDRTRLASNASVSSIALKLPVAIAGLCVGCSKSPSSIWLRGRVAAVGIGIRAIWPRAPGSLKTLSSATASAIATPTSSRGIAKAVSFARWICRRISRLNQGHSSQISVLSDLSVDR